MSRAVGHRWRACALHSTAPAPSIAFHYNAAFACTLVLAQAQPAACWPYTCMGPHMHEAYACFKLPLLCNTTVTSCYVGKVCVAPVCCIAEKKESATDGC